MSIEALADLDSLSVWFVQTRLDMLLSQTLFSLFIAEITFIHVVKNMKDTAYKPLCDNAHRCCVW